MWSGVGCLMGRVGSSCKLGVGRSGCLIVDSGNATFADVPGAPMDRRTDDAGVIVSSPTHRPLYARCLNYDRVPV